MIQPVILQETVSASAQQVANNPVEKQVTFYAKSTNTGVVYIGLNSSVTSSNGYPLEKGESITFVMGTENGNTDMFWYTGTASDILGIAGS